MEENETGEVPKLPPDARLESLDKRLDLAKEAEAKRVGRAQPDPTARIAQLVMGHLIGGPLGGALMGWGLDTVFKTFPLFLLLLLFLGFGIGVWNVFRLSSKSPGSGI